MHATRSLGYILATLSAFAGAVRYVLARYAEGEGLDLVLFLVGALIVSTLCSSTHVLCRDGLSGFRPLRGKTRYALFYGLLMGWSTLSHFIALRFLNETIMSSLAQTTILFTIVLAVWLLRERFTWGEWLAAGVILAGMLVVFRPTAASESAPSGGETRTTGLVIIMVGVIGGAVATIIAKHWIKEIPPRTMMMWRNAVALVAATSFALFEGKSLIFTIPSGIACIAAGVLGSYLHGLWFLQALERIEVAKASLMSRVQPVMVFVLSWVLLARLPGAPEMTGAGLLVVGTLLLAVSAKKPVPPPAAPATAGVQ